MYELHLRGYSGHVKGMMCWLSFLTSMGLVITVEVMEAKADEMAMARGDLGGCFYFVKTMAATTVL